MHVTKADCSPHALVKIKQMHECLSRQYHDEAFDGLDVESKQTSLYSPLLTSLPLIHPRSLLNDVASTTSHCIALLGDRNSLRKAPSGVKTARVRATPFTTASSQKRRRLAPFIDSDLVEGDSLDAPFDEPGLEAHVRSSPASSPQPQSFPITSSTTVSPAASPASSHTTRTGTPPRRFPSHIQDEVSFSREAASGSQSPSGAFAGIHIDGGSSVDMSERELGGNSSTERRVVSPETTFGGRSASPAKRSASDMEGAGLAVGHAGKTAMSGGLSNGHANGESDQGEEMQGVASSVDGLDSQATTVTADSSSTQTPMSVDTSTTSLATDDATPVDGQHDPWRKGSSSKARASPPPTIDEQIRQVHELTQVSLDEGVQGVVVSSKWLARVLSRGSDGLRSSDFSKDDREGEVGVLNNDDIVPSGAFDTTLKDMEGKIFVALNPGLSIGQEVEVLPYAAYGKIADWYGVKLGQHPIFRYAHNTAELPASNIIYELYPPVITIRKVATSAAADERPKSATSGKSWEALKIRKDQMDRGQNSPDDAARLVTARSERYHSFIRRAKAAAGINLTTKVKLWKIFSDGQRTGAPTPSQSRSASPTKTLLNDNTKLVLPTAVFKTMKIDTDVEAIQGEDQTTNPKYNGSSTMEQQSIFNSQIILLEEQMGGPAGGEFISAALKRAMGKSKPASTTASGRTSPTPGGVITRGRARRDGRTRGTIGLTNLGNTCYMNSALQCIRSVEELAIYFLSETYKREINAGNPLGHGGRMAKEYAGVVSGIYSANASGGFTPRSFKDILGRVQPLFSGYGQQDSQEFLSFLVDALHEDLNRIQKKPYNENPDSDDKTVHDPQAIIELGEVYRKNHKARNDSIAMDLFSGFYKNTMECPTCEKVSVTFDPYSLLTVQLPIESTWQHTVTFIPLNGPPVNHMVDIDKNATIKTLKEYIAAKHPGVSGDRIWMAEVYNHKIYKVFDDKLSVAEYGVQSNDYLYLFELEAVPVNIPDPAPKKVFYSSYPKTDNEIPEMDSPKAETFAVPVFQRQKSKFGNGHEMIMHPLYVTITREEAQNYDIIMKKVLVAVSGQTSKRILSEFDESIEQSTEAETPSAETESTGEDAGRVSDRSVPSEDGYVDVSLEKADHGESAEGAHTGSPMQIDPIRSRFMDPSYYLPPALRNHLFEMNYAKSNEGMLCVGVNSIVEASVRPMLERVKLRQTSTDESVSEESNMTGESPAVSAEAEESDADDDEDKPDLVLGGPQAPTDTLSDDGNASEVTLEPIEALLARKTTGKLNKYGRSHARKNKNKGNPITYGKKSQAAKSTRGNRPGSSASTRSSRGKGAPDENPYYIQLREGIVIDWYPEGLDALFGGDKDTAGDLKGHWLSDSTGKTIDYFDDPEVDAKRSRREARKKHGITLEDCFVETGKREILSEDNAWYCNRCKELRQAAKTLEIWTIPDVLIVHLKRFGGTRSFRDKIDVMVDYPIEGLDLTEKIGKKEDGKEYIYDLFAVDNHFGGLGGGHYTAIAKNFYDGQWYDYNGKQSLEFMIHDRKSDSHTHRLPLH